MTRHEIENLDPKVSNVRPGVALQFGSVMIWTPTPETSRTFHIFRGAPTQAEIERADRERKEILNALSTRTNSLGETPASTSPRPPLTQNAKPRRPDRMGRIPC